MRRLSLVLSLAFAVPGFLPLRAVAQQLVAGQPELKVGDPAPDFALQASDGQTYALAKLRGRTVVLAWFPKAFTAG